MYAYYVLARSKILNNTNTLSILLFLGFSSLCSTVLSYQRKIVDIPMKNKEKLIEDSALNEPLILFSIVVIDCSKASA